MKNRGDDNQASLDRLTEFLIENSFDVRDRIAITAQDSLADDHLVSKMLDLFDNALESVKSPHQSADKSLHPTSVRHEVADNVLIFPGWLHGNGQREDFGAKRHGSGGLTRRLGESWRSMQEQMTLGAIRRPAFLLSLGISPSAIAVAVFTAFAIASVVGGIIGGSKVTSQTVSGVGPAELLYLPGSVSFSERWLLNPKATEKLPTLAGSGLLYADGGTLMTPEVMGGPPGYYFKRRVVEGDNADDEGQVSYTLEKCTFGKHAPLICYLPKKQKSSIQKVGPPDLLRDHRD
jgi:hypothetical protein